MLTTRGRTRWSIASLILGSLLFARVPPAHADSPVTCGADRQWDPIQAACTIKVALPGGPSPSDPGKGTGPRNVAGPRVCSLNGAAVPCTSSSGTWSQSRGCYVGPPLIDIPRNNPIWENHIDGAIYACTPIAAFAIPYLFWSATDPRAVVQPPDPRVLAQRAVGAMELRALRIGIVPESGPDRLGLVGLPVWLWAADPGPSTLGPVTRSVSAGGFTVTATARLQRVVWSMGDGQFVSCRGGGTPYRLSYGKTDSPTCGYRYTRQGHYTVTATSWWLVEWSGIGQSGVIPMRLANSVPITIGEAQSLVQ